MNKIVGIGNALVDVLATLEDDQILKEMRLPKGSMQLIDAAKLQEINTFFGQMKTHLATGGSAGNTILGLACLGATTGFIGKVGNDAYGTFFRNNLAANGIEDKLLLSTLSSGVASTFISPEGERTFGTYLGAAATLRAEDITSEMFEGYEYLYIEGYLVQDQEMILRVVDLAEEAGLVICLDLASYNIVEDDDIFFSFLIEEYVDIVFANEEEARALTGFKNPIKALCMLSEMCDIAVVKVGAEGSYVSRGDELVKVQALSVDKVLDTTGAGDYFASGFLYGLTRGYSLEQCAKIGSLLAGYVIQSVGTTLSAVQWDEIKLNINKIISE